MSDPIRPARPLIYPGEKLGSFCKNRISRLAPAWRRRAGAAFVRDSHLGRWQASAAARPAWPWQGPWLRASGGDLPDADQVEQRCGCFPVGLLLVVWLIKMQSVGHIGYLFRQLSRATGSPVSPSHSASCRRTSRVLRTSGRTRDRSSQTRGRPPAVRVR